MFKETVLSSLIQLARPLVRLCIRHGIKLGELFDVVKRVYVVEAERFLQRKEESVSTSRITLMTGVHRTDVAQIRSEKKFAPRERHTASDVISQWRYDPRFSTKPGSPRPLGIEGKDSEFAELVRSVSHSVSPYTVSFELERLGMISKTKDGKVKLTTRVFVPKGDSSAILNMLAEDMDDLIVAVEENAFAKSEDLLPNHHLKTEYHNLPDQALIEIKQWCMKEGSAFHERARNFLSRFDRDLNPNLASGTGRHRVVVGSFSLVEEVQQIESNGNEKSGEDQEIT